MGVNHGCADITVTKEFLHGAYGKKCFNPFCVRFDCVLAVVPGEQDSFQLGKLGLQFIDFFRQHGLDSEWAA